MLKILPVQNGVVVVCHTGVKGSQSDPVQNAHVAVADSEINGQCGLM